MEKWSAKIQTPKWLAPVLFSIFIHAIIVTILVQHELSATTPKQKAQTNTAIKSYLIVAKPKIKKAVVKKQKAPTPPPAKKTIVKKPVAKPEAIKPKTVKPKAPIVKKPEQNAAQEPTVVEKPTSTPTAPTSSMMIINKKPSSISNARDYLNQNQSMPPTSWQEHQFQQTQKKLNEQVENEKAKKYDGKFTPDISGMTDLGKTGDGSQLIKSGDACFVIQKNSLGDSVWLGTPCPLSTDPLRQAYRKSMDKYLKKKQN